MSQSEQLKRCPYCGEQIKVAAVKCRFCQEFLDQRPAEDDDEPVDAVDFIIPAHVSGWAMASCYLGLIGFCLPFIGILFAIPGLVCGILAWQRRSASSSYRSKTSNLRTIVGIVLSSLSIIGYGTILVIMILSNGFR